jgi:predicted nucleotidyltransferase
MQVNKNEIIAGAPATTLRDFLKKAPDDFNVSAVGALLWKPEQRNREYLEELVTLGYLSKDEHGYHKTDQALRFGKAKFLNQLTRRRADILLNNVICTAAAINNIDELTHYVEELHVFGSYLTDAPNLSDLDIIVCLMPKSEDPREQLARSIERAEASGKQMGFLDQAAYGENEVLRLLKGPSRHLDLCDRDHLSLPGLESKLVFSAFA